MTLHDGAKVHDVYELWKEYRRDISLVPMIPDTFPYATFAHIMGGYDVGYYGYLYSQVFSADMFMSKFKEGGLEGGGVGLEYRRCVLEPGGSRDGKDLLKSFLGREASSEAFMKSLLE
jgi:thimet oligopeptidase